MGQRFGWLTVTARASKNNEGRAMWSCLCDCGKTHIVPGKSLRKGFTTSCGCNKRALISQKKQQDISGQRFGRLIALHRVTTQKWFCKCDCGNQITASTNVLRSGNTRSCGCLRDEAVQENARRRIVKPVVGQKYNRITVEAGAAKRSASGTITWPCRCDCGTKLFCNLNRLKSGNTKSCGCLQREKASQNGKAFGRHNRRDDGPAQFCFDPAYANRPAYIYFCEVNGCYQKLGIAFDVALRGRKSYTQVWFSRQMTRANCWAVEQMALWATKDHHVLQPSAELSLRCGLSELRLGLPIEETVQMLDEMADKCERVGWLPYWEQLLACRQPRRD
jgi:hypothetical protein